MAPAGFSLVCVSISNRVFVKKARDGAALPPFAGRFKFVGTWRDPHSAAHFLRRSITHRGWSHFRGRKRIPINLQGGEGSAKTIRFQVAQVSSNRNSLAPIFSCQPEGCCLQPASPHSWGKKKKALAKSLERRESCHACAGERRRVRISRAQPSQRRATRDAAGNCARSSGALAPQALPTASSLTPAAIGKFGTKISGQILNFLLPTIRQRLLSISPSTAVSAKQTELVLHR